MNILGMKHYICCLSLTTRTVWVIGQLAGLVFTNPNKIQKLYYSNTDKYNSEKDFSLKIK